MKRIARLGIPLIVLAGAGVWYVTASGPGELVLTGIVTTHDVVVSPLVGGRVAQLTANEGETVAEGDLLAVIEPAELQAERAYYSASADGVAAQVQEGEAALRFEQRQSADQVRQAEANVAAVRAERAAAEADLENVRMDLDRVEMLARDGIAPAQQLDQARLAYDAAQARVEALDKQVEAQMATVELARAQAEQVTVKRSQLQADRHRLAAADAQRAKADVRLAYSEVRAPIPGVVSVLAARQGEVVNAGQPLVTLLDEDDLWVRADLEETYVDRVRIGDTFTVRLPSGAERAGTVFFRAVDGGFATQRDVSRTKRDIRTFEIRLRVDNSDRRLAVGMTAYVAVPLADVAAETPEPPELEVR